MRLLVSGIFSVMAITLVCNSGSLGGDDKKPKFTMKQIMVDGHKNGLLEKVVKGKADEEEKKKLVSMYEALCLYKSPNDEAEDWTMKTNDLLKLAKAVANGEDVADKLGTAANCKACHSVHKKKKS